MFKKILLCLSIVFLIAILSLSKEKTTLVYNEIEAQANDYKQIYLLFENNILNTNNFEDYLKDFRVLKIYPYVNPVYAGRLRANYGYIFTKENHLYDLERFKTSFTEKIRSLGLIKEANDYELKGITINKVLVYSTLDQIYLLINQNKNIKYSFNFTGIYKNI